LNRLLLALPDISMDYLNQPEFVSTVLNLLQIFSRVMRAAGQLSGAASA
jgi:hypothetical protein